MPRQEFENEGMLVQPHCTDISPNTELLTLIKTSSVISPVSIKLAEQDNCAAGKHTTKGASAET